MSGGQAGKKKGKRVQTKGMLTEGIVLNFQGFSGIFQGTFRALAGCFSLMPFPGMPFRHFQKGKKDAQKKKKKQWCVC